MWNAQNVMLASTFKVPHALFAPDAGAVRDDVPGFGGMAERDFDGWNQDQTLRSSMRHSTVWVYQQFAREIGEVREKEYLTGFSMARRPVRRCRDRFWLDGVLRISAMEQVDFLENCIETSFRSRSRHRSSIKDIMIEAGRLILRAKTGRRKSNRDGWWVGWSRR